MDCFGLGLRFELLFVAQEQQLEQLVVAVATAGAQLVVVEPFAGCLQFNHQLIVVALDLLTQQLVELQVVELKQLENFGLFGPKGFSLKQAVVALPSIVVVAVKALVASG